MTITEFLLARIAADEAVARGAVGSHWDGHYYREVRTAVGDDPSYYSVTAERQIFEHWDQSRNRVDPGTTYKHIARHDPARVLAECAAKRAIVATHDNALTVRADNDVAMAHNDGECEALDAAVRALAAVYADHEDYRPEWGL